MGETLHQVAVARDELDVNIKHAFIDPLQDLHNMELKDIRVKKTVVQVCNLSNVRATMDQM